MVKCNKNMKLNRIKAVLEEKGISQTWLSKKMGMEKPRDFDPFGHAGLSPLVTI